MMKLLLLLVLVSYANSVFIEEPRSAIVAENDTAVFRCRISSGIQGWFVDGVSVDSQHNPDFDADSESASDGGPPIHTLSIVARDVYNGTTVQCLAFSPSGNSSLATLQIQGLLDAVTELTATPLTEAIHFSWAAPFSLDLTNTEHDITYCVDVSTSGRAELVASECNLTQTWYDFAADVRSPCDAFEAVVTPVNKAGNGSESVVEGYFFEAPMLNMAPTISYRFEDDEQVLNVSVDFHYVLSICTYDVIINSRDGIAPPINRVIPLSTNTGQQIFTFSLNTTDIILLDRIYSLVISLTNSAGSDSTQSMCLSSHAVQDVHMLDANSPNETNLQVDFTEQSLAPGCVVIITSSDGTLEYVFVGYRLLNSTSDGLVVTGLSRASYEVAAYDLETMVMPGTYVARNISIPVTTEDMNASSNVEIDGAVMSVGKLIHPNSDRMVCAQCADVTATECLLILHPVGDLTELETLIVQNNGENCTQVRSSEDYVYSCFGRKDGKIVQLSNGVPSVLFVIATVVDISVYVTVTVTPDGSSFAIIAIIIPCIILVVVVAAVALIATVTAVSFKYRKTLLTKLRMWKKQKKWDSPDVVVDVETSSTRLIAYRGSNPMTLPPLPSRRLDTDSSSPTSESNPMTLPPPLPPSDDIPDPDPTYDTVKPPDKTPEKAEAGPVYATPDPRKKFQAPPALDTKVLYDDPAGYKSDGKMYAIPDVKTSKKKTKPKDEHTVTYGTIDHSATTTVITLEPAKDPVPVLVPVPEPTKEMLFAKLYPVKDKWQALGEQFKQDEDRLDEIFTNDEMSETRLHEVIRYWYLNGDFDHTWSEVVTALEAIGEQTLADDIRTNYVLPGTCTPNLPGIPQYDNPEAVSVQPPVPAFHTSVHMDTDPEEEMQSTQPVYLPPCVSSATEELSDDDLANEHADLSIQQFDFPNNDPSEERGQAVYVSSPPPSYDDACNVKQDTDPHSIVHSGVNADSQFTSRAINMCPSAIAEEGSDSGSVAVSVNKVTTDFKQQQTDRNTDVPPVVSPENDCVPLAFCMSYSQLEEPVAATSHQQHESDVSFVPFQPSNNDIEGKLTLIPNWIGSVGYTIMDILKTNQPTKSVQVDYMVRRSFDDEDDGESESEISACRTNLCESRPCDDDSECPPSGGDVCKLLSVPLSYWFGKTRNVLSFDQCSYSGFSKQPFPETNG